VMFQVFLNMIFAPLNAVFADRVPDRQKGAVSGWLSLRSPLGTAIGAAIIGGALRGEGARFIALALVVLCTAPPFALILRDRPTPPRTAPPRLGPPRLVPSQAWRPPSRGFVLFWVTRFLVQFSMACATGYLLYYLEDLFGPGVRARAEERVALLAVLSTIAGAATGPLSGFATSRLQGRLRMALAGAAVIALGLGLLAAHLGWIAALIAAGLLGAGYGCYAAMDTAIAAQVLPSLDHAGRDLGLLNLANTLPQVAAPLAAWLIFSLTKGHLGFTALYMIAGGASLVGGLAAQGIRAPRPRRRQII
jgi:MFS family permease